MPPDAAADPTPTPAPDAQPAAKQSIFDWARDRHTKRSELCLAAMVAGWPAEVPDPEAWESAAEVMITGAEYDEAIRQGRFKATEVRSRGGFGASRFDVLPHPELLLAICVKRPSPMDCDRFLRGLMSDEVTEKQEALVQIFNDCIVWPTGDALVTLRNNYPLAWLVFASKLGEIAGLAKNESKKKR